MNSVQKKLDLKFFCTEFVTLLPLPPKHQKDLSYVDIMKKTERPRRMEWPSEDVCLRVLTFSRKVLKVRVERTGRSRRRTLPWMATGAVPVRIRTATHFSSQNSHPETLHRGRMFRSPWAFVRLRHPVLQVMPPNS